MKSLIQRVSEAKVVADGETTGAIGPGILVLLGLEKGDEDESQAKLDYHVNKLTKLRIFPDEAGKMNRSIQDISGQFLVVSQFTLAGDCRKGTRPSFDNALPPHLAEPLYERFVTQLRDVSGCPVETGVFGAMMDVHLVNDGPVTFMLEC